MHLGRVHTLGGSRTGHAPRIARRATTVGVIPTSTSSSSRGRGSKELSFRVFPRGHKVATGAKVQSSTGPAPDLWPSSVPRHIDRFYCLDAVASRARAAFRRLHDLWEPLQVNHCGKYSIERMMAFDEYCRSTSRWRVVAVCLLTPLPPVVIVVLMEIPPLRPPAAGCLDNYVFWLRHWFAIGVILWTGILQGKQWIPELPLSHTRMIAMSFACAGVYVALNVLVGYLWVFPIPFLAVLGGGVLFPIWIAAIVLAVGYQKLMDVPDIRSRLKRFLDMQGAQSTLMLLYPANNAVFLAIPSAFRLAYIVVLPAINLAMKNVIAAKGSHLEDRLPETVVFSVDVFSALYSVFCMRSSNTLSSVSVVVVFDVVIIALGVHGMLQRTLLTQELILETTPPEGGPTRRHAIAAGLAADTEEVLTPTPRLINTAVVSQMLSRALGLLQHPGMLDADDLREIRLLSGTQHRLSPANTALLKALEQRAIYDNARAAAGLLSFAQLKARYSSNSTRRISLQHQISQGSLKIAAGQRISMAIRKSGAMVPGPPIDACDASAPPALSREAQLLLHPFLEARHPALRDALQLARKKNTAAVHEVLQLLFSSEYLVLIAYVQCVIPPMFILYSSVLHNLPNAVYYPRAAELQSDSQLRQRLDAITFYWGLELLLLLGVYLVLRRVFALAAMYQVAFVLESHALLVQCKLIFTLIFAVQSTVEHYGADYSFSFEWLRHPPQGDISGQGTG